MGDESIAALRRQALSPKSRGGTIEQLEVPQFYESETAATTHFVIVDSRSNVVTATQSLGVHLGAGVVAPGTGVVLNNSMSNFDFRDARNANFLAPGRRPRGTIAPTIVLQGGKPLLALGVPGSSRIPTALLQVLLDRLALGRPLAEAIGDTRFHFFIPHVSDASDTLEAEQSLPGRSGRRAKAARLAGGVARRIGARALFRWY